MPLIKPDNHQPLSQNENETARNTARDRDRSCPSRDRSDIHKLCVHIARGIHILAGVSGFAATVVRSYHHPRSLRVRIEGPKQAWNPGI